MFTFFMIKELILTTQLLFTPLASGQIGNDTKYTYFYNSNEMVNGTIYKPNTHLGTDLKEVYSYSMPENPTISGSLNIKQKSYMEKDCETLTVNDNGTYKTQSVYNRVMNLIIIQYEVRENTTTDANSSYILINYPQIPNDMINQSWKLYTFDDAGSYYNQIDALFSYKEQNANECYTNIETITDALDIEQTEVYRTTYDYLPRQIPIDIDISLQEGEYGYFGISLEMSMTQTYNDGVPEGQLIDYTKYYNFTQFPQYTYWDITYTFIVEESTYEVIDITRLLIDLAVMPFTFISQAFGLVLFAGTVYEINVANIVFSLLAVMLIVFIVRKFIL